MHEDIQVSRTNLLGKDLIDNVRLQAAKKKTKKTSFSLLICLSATKCDLVIVGESDVIRSCRELFSSLMKMHVDFRFFKDFMC